MIDSVIVGIELVVDSYTTAETVVLQCSHLTARTLVILNVSAAGAVLGKIDVLIRDSRVIVAILIVAISAIGTAVMNGYAALTVDIRLEGVAGSAVVVLFPSSGDTVEAVDDNGLADG